MVFGTISPTTTDSVVSARRTPTPATESAVSGVSDVQRSSSGPTFGEMAASA
jgi:hypothetical protein